MTRQTTKDRDREPPTTGASFRLRDFPGASPDALRVLHRIEMVCRKLYTEDSRLSRRDMAQELDAMLDRLANEHTID